MAIVLDHTIVPAKDKVASAEFFADIFGLTVKPGEGYFAQVQINESLTFDFADEPKPQSHHYAFHISEAEFEAIFGRVKAKGLSYGSESLSTTPTSRSIPAVAGVVSTSKTLTGTCWRL